jgi:hypothetical protein
MPGRKPKIDLTTVLEGYAKKSKLLIFACNEYPNASNLPTLNCAVNDGKLIEKTLGKLDFDLVRAYYNEEVTKKNIEEAFENICRNHRLKDMDVGRLYIMFAGHGLVGESDDAIFCCHDFDPDDEFSTSFTLNKINDKLEHVGIKHIQVHFDCCHAGGLFLHSRGEQVDYVAADAASKPSVRGITAVSRSEEAVEVGDNGIFTKTLCKYLDPDTHFAFDRFQKDYVTMTEVFTLVKSEVQQEARRSKRSMTPMEGILLPQHGWKTQKEECTGDMLFFRSGADLSAYKGDEDFVDDKTVGSRGSIEPAADRDPEVEHAPKDVPKDAPPQTNVGSTGAPQNGIVTQVTCPPGLGPGSTFNASINGFSMSVTVPPNIHEGQVFGVRMPSSAELGRWQYQPANTERSITTEQDPSKSAKETNVESWESSPGGEDCCEQCMGNSPGCRRNCDNIAVATFCLWICGAGIVFPIVRLIMGWGICGDEAIIIYMGSFSVLVARNVIFFGSMKNYPMKTCLFWYGGCSNFFLWISLTFLIALIEHETSTCIVQNGKYNATGAFLSSNNGKLNDSSLNGLVYDSGQTITTWSGCECEPVFMVKHVCEGVPPDEESGRNEYFYQQHSLPLGNEYLPLRWCKVKMPCTGGFEGLNGYKYDFVDDPCECADTSACSVSGLCEIKFSEKINGQSKPIVSWGGNVNVFNSVRWEEPFSNDNFAWLISGSCCQVHKTRTENGVRKHWRSCSYTMSDSQKEFGCIPNLPKNLTRLMAKAHFGAQYNHKSMVGDVTKYSFCDTIDVYKKYSSMYHVLVMIFSLLIGGFLCIPARALHKQVTKHEMAVTPSEP